MKLEIGMYVRTNHNGIKKVDIDNYHEKLPNNPYEYNKHDIYEIDVIKSSFNIIDLIEKDDYVNGWKVLKRIKEDGFSNELYINDHFCETSYSSLSLKSWDGYIKSIVTKEQFQSMEYKI